tara:strand:+ start:2016 stop:2234 length:219 start_codon:yes stop_codon:yes gene_type:complete
MTLENKKIINANNEKRFFLCISIRLRLDYETTAFQLKDIHKRIGSGDKDLQDYSFELQKIYGYYLVHLGLIV